MCRPYAGSIDRVPRWCSSFLRRPVATRRSYSWIGPISSWFTTPDHKSAILRKISASFHKTRAQDARAHTIFHGGRGHRSRSPLPRNHGGRESKPRRRSQKIRRSPVRVFESSGRLCAGLVKPRGQGALPPGSRDGTCPRGRQRQRGGSEGGGGHCHMRESSSRWDFILLSQSVGESEGRRCRFRNSASNEHSRSRE